MPLKPGQVKKEDCNYERHGTGNLFIAFEPACGQRHVAVTERRTQQDWAQFIQSIVDDFCPGAERITLVCDQLNTHQSESLVRLVAARCGLSDELGEKGKTGVLQSLWSRAAFLSDPSHRIQFVYVPKHTSWLNQIEIWFSILVRRVIKRGNFSSVEALRERILAFIAYFNRTAKPFRWTYTGRPLSM